MPATYTLLLATYIALAVALFDRTVGTPSFQYLATISSQPAT